MDLSDGEGDSAEDAMGKKGEDGRRKVGVVILIMIIIIQLSS